MTDDYESEDTKLFKSMYMKQVHGIQPDGGGRKYVPVDELRSMGIVSEINRTILHPLGMALEVQQTPAGNFVISGVWDERDDPEGMLYAGDEMMAAVKRNKEAFWSLWNDRTVERASRLGYMVQPV